MALVGLGMDDERLAGVADAGQPVVELGRTGPPGEAVDLVEHDHPALGCASRERLAEGGLAHPLRDPLPVRPAIRAEHDATVAPVRRTGRSLTGAAGALLAPGLRAAAG